jgi:hypothetical protein
LTSVSAWTTGKVVLALYYADLTSFSLPTTMQLVSSAGTQDLDYIDHEVDASGNRYVALYGEVATLSATGTTQLRVTSAQSRPKGQSLVQTDADTTDFIFQIAKGTGRTATFGTLNSTNNYKLMLMMGWGSSAPGSGHTGGEGWSTVAALDSTDGGGQGKGYFCQESASSSDLTCTPTLDTVDSTGGVWMAIELQETAGAAATSSVMMGPMDRRRRSVYARYRR